MQCLFATFKYRLFECVNCRVVSFSDCNSRQLKTKISNQLRVSDAIHCRDLAQISHELAMIKNFVKLLNMVNLFDI